MTENIVKKVVFITSTLNQSGGGERLLLEGVKYYHKIGIDVHVITWNFDKKYLFDGKYTIPKLINFDIKLYSQFGSYKFMINRIFYIFKFRKVLKNIKPDLIISLSENDTTILNLAQFCFKKNYVTLIFGQMFQFPFDPNKYSLIFKKHLKSIVNSFTGYRDTIPFQNPSKNIFKNFVVEIWSLLRYIAVKNSIKTFVFSKQVQWEVELLYNRKSQILKGAYEKELLKFSERKNSKFDYRDNPSQVIILMINRLELKKRVHLAIEALVEVIKFNSNVKLIICGLGSQSGILQKMIEELKLEKHVSLIGYVNDDDIYQIIINTDLFMSLDIADFNISPFVALALKKSIIWTDEMDMDQDLINCGLINIVTPDRYEVSKAILEYVNNKSSIEINKNYEFLENYTWEKYFDTILHSLHGKS